MGSAASTPGAQMAAKHKMNETMNQAKDGLRSVTGAKTDEQKEREQRSVDRNAEYELKKKEREERKKKLAAQRAAHMNSRS